MKKNKGRVVFLHGVRTKRSDRNMHKLAVAFRRAGFCVTIPMYGYLSALVVGLFGWLDDHIAQAMSVFIEPDDIIVGHSNGGTLAYLLSKLKRVRGVVLINAALEVDLVPDAEFTHVYFNPGDCVAQWSSILPFHPWGSMGGLGYIGDDPRVTNYHQCNPGEPSLPCLNGHSAIFERENVRAWGKYITEQVELALATLRVL